MWTKITQLLDVLRQIAQAHEVPVGQVAINWSLKHPYMTAALVGVRTPEQAAQNAADIKQILSVSAVTVKKNAGLFGFSFGQRSISP